MVHSLTTTKMLISKAVTLGGEQSLSSRAFSCSVSVYPFVENKSKARPHFSRQKGSLLRCSTDSNGQSKDEKEKRRIWKQLEQVTSLINQIISTADMFGQFSSTPPRTLQEETSSIFDRQDEGSSPQKKIKWKKINFKVSHKASRIVEDLEEAKDTPVGFNQYLCLPVSEYALLDPKFITRLEGDAFRLKLPLGDILGGLGLGGGSTSTGNEMIPQMVIRPELSALEQKLVMKGDQAGLGIPSLDDRFDLDVFVESVWSKHSRGQNLDHDSDETLTKQANQHWHLACDVEVVTRLDVPSPYAMVPSVLLKSLCKLVAKGVLINILPQFIDLLVEDYKRWGKASDGMREVDVAVGNLSLANASEEERPRVDDSQTMMDTGEVNLEVVGEDGSVASNEKCS